MALNHPADVREQYRDSKNLGARIDLHARFGTSTQPWHAWVFDHLGLAAGTRVLEVGCGPGLLWRTNLDRVPDGTRIALTDMSPGMVGEARTAIADGRFSFAAADAQSLPFAGASAHVLVANHMLYHVPDLDAALAEFARMLTCGGRVVAATNGAGHMVELVDLVTSVGIDVTRWSYVRAFGLDNGAAPLARHFDDVQVVRNPGVLAVTDPDAVVAYIGSMGRVRAGAVDGGVGAEIRRRVQDAIDEHGSFRISTDAGVFLARAR